MKTYKARFTIQALNRKSPKTAWRTQLDDRTKRQHYQHVLKKFRVIYGSMRQHFREVERTCGVSGSQLWVIQEISNSSGIGVSDLAERLSIHQSTCSQLVEKLVARKLIIKERSKQDQRRVGLRLTEEAVNLIVRAPAPTQGLLPEILNALPAETIQSLDDSLAQVIEQLRLRDSKLADQPLSDM